MYDFQGNRALLPFDALRGRNPQGGKTYYVNDVTGNNSHEGTDPEFPLATLAAAYAKCVTERNDYVFVQRHTTTGKLTIAINDVHIIGLHSGMGLDQGGRLCINGVADIGVELTTPEYCEIAGFEIGGNGTSPAVQATGQCMFLHLHHCQLAQAWVSATDGIYTPGGGGFNECVFDHLMFGMSISAYGWHAGMNTGMIAHSLFKQNESGCIYLNPEGQWVNILDNRFFADIGGAPAVGWAINLDPNCDHCLVAGNEAGDAGDDSGNIPYRDQSTGALATKHNGWTRNYHGEVLTPPQAAA